jgi:hypothetical protein
MAKLLSGSILRSGGSGDFITLQNAQPQLPATDTTSTGYTLVTDYLLRTTYRSSLGNLEFNKGTIYSNIADGNITLSGTGTGIVLVSATTVSTGTSTGALVVNGGVGVGGTIWAANDIVANGVTIGQGYKGSNNIVLRGDATPQLNEFNDGQLSVAIGYDTLTGLSSSYKNIAIGRYALSSGTMVSNSIAIGDSALKSIGILHKTFAGNIDTITATSPVIITTNSEHFLTSGTKIAIENVISPININGETYYIKVIGIAQFEVYTNNILSIPLDGTSYPPYTQGTGIVSKVLVSDSNIAIGVDAATSLIDGEKNFFFGHSIAKNLVTGSYNFLVGHEVANNMITGNANISIGGDLLVDGQDNQISIGSIFYYDGKGFLQINTDTGIVGSNSTSTSSGALTVSGGVGISGSVYSANGNPDEGNLLYTPKVTISVNPPTNPRIGDFWIDPTLAVEFQYVKDGNNKFWIQFAGL